MMAPYNHYDIDIVARTLFGEARGEGSLGMRAVAHVIRNRVRDKRWRDTYAEVCLRSKQFSAWNRRNPQYPLMRDIGLDNATYRIAYAIAAEVMAAESEDVTQGANHYFATSIDPPSWADPVKETVTIQSHRFFKL